jgi:spore maturation protein CgeB
VDKIKLLLAWKAFPFTMASYFLRAIQRRDDIELVTCGEFYGQWIPWANGIEIPMKYLNEVDIPLPRGMDRPAWEIVKPHLSSWQPDLVLNIDSNFHFSTKPDAPYAVVGTDPHVLTPWYSQVKPIADWFFGMQPSYLQGNDIILPYAFDKDAHYPDETVEKEYDCCMVGLHYAHRDEWVRRLREVGITVNYRIGDIYDEYREENNKARIGLIWSSMQDVIARVFEVMAMRMIPVMNRLPGLDFLGFEEGRHYLGFSTMDEAVSQVKWAKEHPDFANQIANNAYRFVHERNMTWDARVEQILKDCKLVV